MARIGQHAKASPSTATAAPGSLAGSVGVVSNRVAPASALRATRSTAIGEPTLPNSDFIELAEPRRQANAMVFGGAGSGKSTFATMYAPEPLAFINFDRRAHHAVARAKEAGRKIHYAEIGFPANITKLDMEAAKKLAQAAVDKTIRNFEVALEESLKGNIRTIAFDTGTEYSELVKIAITGRVDRTKGDYGQSKDLINREWWRLLNLAREGNAHFILLARAREIWENSEPTGRFSFRGPEVMNDGVDWAAHIRLKRRRKKNDPKVFEIEVTKAGVSIEELGAVYTQEEWSELGGPFVMSCVYQYPGTSPEDWQ